MLRIALVRVRYNMVHYRTIQYSRIIRFFILFTICLRLTAVAGRCSQLASVCNRCPYLANDRTSRTPHPVLFFYNKDSIYVLLLVEPPSVLIAGVGLVNDDENNKQNKTNRPRKSSAFPRRFFQMVSLQNIQNLSQAWRNFPLARDSNSM